MEFVVDNLTVCGLANGTLAVTNTKYSEQVHGIRKGIYEIYRQHCDYKAEVLEPVDWRAREFNTGADHLASYAIATSSSGGTIQKDCVKQHMPSCKALQVFTDGGFIPGKGGGYGIQLIGHFGTDLQPESVVIGFAYKFDKDASSAFAMELAGLSAAVRMALAFFS